MKLSISYLFLMVSLASTAAALPARFLRDPVAGLDESGSVLPSSPLDPPSNIATTLKEPTTIPASATDSVPTSPSDPSTKFSSKPSDPAEPTAPVTPSTPTQAPTTNPDAPTTTPNVPTSVPSTKPDVPTTKPEHSTTDVSTTTELPPTQTKASSSTSRSSPTRSSVVPPSQQTQTYLDAHNLVRRVTNAPDLKWSDELQATAKAYAERCQLRHSDGELGPVGENLAAATGSFDALSAVKLFVQDEADFKPEDIVLSHFTQVVWKSTTSLGCGAALCDNIFPGKTATYHVCLYDPVGNVVGEEKENLNFD